MNGLLKSVFGGGGATAKNPSRTTPQANASQAETDVAESKPEKDAQTTTPNNDGAESMAEIEAGNRRGNKAVVVLRGDPSEKPKNILNTLSQDQLLDEDEYKEKLREYQSALLCLQRSMAEEKKRGLVVVIEGPDAAGKGGVIKRVTEKLDPRTIRVYSIIKPTEEEYSRHYLWRFWTKVPPYGHFAIFDRSWYGRVLVERVEGFARPDEWKRAYRELNEFERQLIDDGAVLVKFFLMITKDEQLSRFKRRSADPLKHWKISEEDWRNRRKWDEHLEAAGEMFEKTATKDAPWHIIPSNSKWFARLQTLRIIVRALERAGIKA